ncbi:MAG: NAD-binding protein [Candidatus Schekmanbacteria bacterium]|nr:NAD-binding protein [Candidatus Schekmanbacteria bacterium]
MNVIIIGSGRVGSELANMLSLDGHNVTVIDTEPASFRKLGTSFNGMQVIGSGTDEVLLRDVKADEADVFVAITNKDNVNIMAAQVAKTLFNIPKVIAKIDDPTREKGYLKHDFGIVSGTHLVSAFIWNEISQRPFKVCQSYTSPNQVVRFEAKEAIIGQKIGDLNRGDDFMICGIIRREGYLSATPDRVINAGDELVGVVRTNFIPKLGDVLD